MARVAGAFEASLGVPGEGVEIDVGVEVAIYRGGSGVVVRVLAVRVGRSGVRVGGVCDV